MAQSIFTSQTPVGRDAADGTDSYTMGTYFTPAVDGTVTHIRWWFPQSGQPGGVAPKANLFRNSDQAKLGGTDAVFAYPGTPDGWNQVALSSPVPVTAGVTYCAAIRTPLRYVFSSGGDSPWPLTNGDLSTPTSAGRFVGNANTTVDFPTNNFNNACYFADLVFEPSGVDPAEGSAALGLGFAVAAVGGADAEGLAALGLNLAVAAAGARRAQGEVALDLGLNLAAAGARDSLGSAALGLDLSVSTSGARSASGASALSLNLALAARGSDGEAGRPVAAWPYGAREVSGYPWTPRPVKSFSGEVG